MSDHTSTTVRPEVEAFVAEVRSRLADLSADEREELLGGLEADLSEQIADGATDLGDPWLYAAELRAAAGLPESRRPRVRLALPRLRMPSRTEVLEVLDDARREWATLVDRHEAGRQAWTVAVALRPAWWVLRAWVLVTALDVAAGPWEAVSMVPTLGHPLVGPALLLAAVVASTLIGLGRLWPASGPDRLVNARLALLAMNVAAVVGLLAFAPIDEPGYLSWQPRNVDSVSYVEEVGPRDGLRVDGVRVTNLFVYDAEGRPVQGAQVFRPNGQPLTIDADQAWTGRGDERTVGCAWTSGTTPLFNVYPQPQRRQRRGACADVTPEQGVVTAAIPPFAQVPPVSSPLPLDPTAPTPEPETDQPDPDPAKVGGAASERPKTRQE